MIKHLLNDDEMIPKSAKVVKSDCGTINDLTQNKLAYNYKLRSSKCSLKALAYFSVYRSVCQTYKILSNMLVYAKQKNAHH